VQPINFISFITVIGFFFGIIFSILTTKTPESMLLYSIIISFAFYMIAHVSISIFVRFIESKPHYFERSFYEETLDQFVYELQKRELIIEDDSANMTEDEIVKAATGT